MRIAVVFALVALWLPATSHALLEQAGWIHHEEAEHTHSHDGEDHHHPAANDHDAADGICRVESGAIDTPIPSGELCWLAGYALWNVLTSITDEPGFSGPSPPGTAPPELQVTWQFCIRAAVPVRAPSLFS